MVILLCSLNAALSNDEMFALFDEMDKKEEGKVTWAEFKKAFHKRGFDTEFINVWF